MTYFATLFNQIHGLQTTAPAPAPAAPAPAPIPASALSPAPAPAAPAVAPTAAPSPTGMIGSPIQPAPKPSNVDFAQETVEGRIGRLLNTNERGDYTNQIVRQAVDRQNQAFNERGMLNSSMAMQAGQEAAISKASEIAAADAQTYANAAEKQRDFDRSESVRMDEQNFQLRGDYQTAVREVNTNFQKMVDTINASDMIPSDKSVAIAQAQSVRDGELAYQNNLFSRMPNWRSEWLALSVPTSGMNFSGASRDTLINVINDPAQPQATRDAAQAQLQSAPAAAPAPTTPQWKTMGEVPSDYMQQYGGIKDFFTWDPVRRMYRGKDGNFYEQNPVQYGD